MHWVTLWAIFSQTHLVTLIVEYISYICLFFTSIHVYMYTSGFVPTLFYSITALLIMICCHITFPDMHTYVHDAIIGYTSAYIGGREKNTWKKVAEGEERHSVSLIPGRQNLRQLRRVK
jgi:hypothetical protein